MTELIIVCAWCDTETGRKDGKGESGYTSTICPECKDDILDPAMVYNKGNRRFERKVAA
jgi:hypothetical protein